MKHSLAGLLFLAAAAVACNTSTPPAHNQAPFSVVEATIPQMQQAMLDGRTSSRHMVEEYLQRIGLYNDKFNAVITVNPKALEEADRLDQEHKAGKIPPRQPHSQTRTATRSTCRSPRLSLYCRRAKRIAPRQLNCSVN